MPDVTITKTVDPSASSAILCQPDEVPVVTEPEFADDLFRLLREGLVALTADELDATPRFTLTVRGREAVTGPVVEEVAYVRHA